MYDGNRREYASSPCMMHAFEERDDELGLRILYLRIEETGDGFRWQVRLHGEPEPIASDVRLFGSESAAQSAGNAALDKACGQFRAFKGFG